MNTPQKYRKRPVEIDAMQWKEGNGFHVRDWINGNGGEARLDNKADEPGIYIATLEGEMKASPFDYVIRGVQGEFYPCKPDIFAATYEAVPE